MPSSSATSCQHRRNHRGTDGEDLKRGGWRGWTPFLSPLPLPRLMLSFRPVSFSFFAIPLFTPLSNSARRHGKAPRVSGEKRQPVAEVGGDQTDWSSRSPELEWTRRAGRTTEHKTVIECAPRRKTHSTTGSAVLLLSMLCIGYSDLSSCSLSVLDYNQKSNQKRRNTDNYQCLFRAFFKGKSTPTKN